MKICSIDGCGKPFKARGWCQTHYQGWYETGDALRRFRPLPKGKKPRQRRDPRIDMATLEAATRVVDISRAVGSSGAAVGLARRYGLTIDCAERWCDRLGLHPAAVWAHWRFVVAEWDDIQHARFGQRPCEECAALFGAIRNNQRFCSPTCSRRWFDRDYRRRKRASDPVYAELNRERRRRYYRQCGDYERARQRAYDRAKAAARKVAA
jgi:hypothetical protein